MPAVAVSSTRGSLTLRDLFICARLYHFPSYLWLSLTFHNASPLTSERIHALEHFAAEIHAHIAAVGPLSVVCPRTTHLNRIHGGYFRVNCCRYACMQKHPLQKPTAILPPSFPHSSRRDEDRLAERARSSLQEETKLLSNVTKNENIVEEAQVTNLAHNQPTNRFLNENRSDRL